MDGAPPPCGLSPCPSPCCAPSPCVQLLQGGSAGPRQRPCQHPLAAPGSCAHPAAACWSPQSPHLPCQGAASAHPTLALRGSAAQHLPAPQQQQTCQLHASAGGLPQLLPHCHAPPSSCNPHHQQQHHLSPPHPLLLPYCRSRRPLHCLQPPCLNGHCLDLHLSRTGQHPTGPWTADCQGLWCCSAAQTGAL